MENKYILLTGATSGIGLEALKEFNRRNIKVVCLVRNLEKLDKVIKEFNLDTSLIQGYYYNQATLSSIEDLKETLKDLDKEAYGVIFNSGIYYPKDKTIGKVNKTVMVNYLGAFKLFMVLSQMGIITKETKSVFVTSLTSHFSSNIGKRLSDFNMQANNNTSYSYSKALINEFAYKLYLDGYKIYLSDPGVFRSNILSSGDGGFSKLFISLGNIFLKVFLPNCKKASNAIVYPIVDELSKPFIKPSILNIYGKMKEYNMPKKFKDDNIIIDTLNFIDSIA